MDTWDEGNSYDKYMGRWSRPIARNFVAWLNVPRGAGWLDVGCGTGALTGTIAAQTEPARLAGIDPSADFISTARLSLGKAADLRVGDAQNLPFADAEFDAAVSGLALNFVPDPAQAVRELRRVTRPGGTVGLYVWDYASGMEMIRTFWDVVVSHNPSAVSLDESNRFPLCHPEVLSELFRSAELHDEETIGLVAPTTFESFDDFWDPLLGGQGPAPSYVTSLNDPDRVRLRESLRSAFGAGTDAFTLQARAWAVKAIV